MHSRGERSRVFERTLEDLQDDAYRKKNVLDRIDVDAIYLKRGISPEEAVAIERALSSTGTVIEEAAEEMPEVSDESSSTMAELAPTAVDHLLRISRKRKLLSHAEEIECGDAIQQAQQLPPDADNELTLRIKKRSEKAKDKLVTRNVRLVVKIAFDKPYRGRMDTDDLVQMGLIGLMKAAERFDPSWQTRFSTYATWWIRQAMSRGIADQGATVRIPVYMRQSISVYQRTYRKLAFDQGGIPSTSTIAEKRGWTMEYTAKVATFADQRTMSLEEPLGGEDNLSLKDVIADGAPQPDEVMIARDMADRVWSMVGGLGDERLADIVYRRFGFYGSEETLEQIGSGYGVTRERIRQLEAKALRILRIRARKANLESPNS